MNIVKLNEHPAIAKIVRSASPSYKKHQAIINAYESMELNKHTGAADMNKAFKLDGMQIETIIDKLVPLVAAPEDYEFFRGVLCIKAEESTSGEFAAFVSKLLKSI